MDVPLDYRLWFEVRERLLASWRRRRSARKVGAFIALYTGFRRSEIVDLKREDIDFVHGSIYVRRRKKKSGNVAVLFPLHPELAELLRNRKTAPSFAYVLTNSVRPMNPRSLSVEFARRVRKERLRVRTSTGSVRRLRFHDLRHLFALRMLQESGNVEVVRRLLGHVNVRTTLTYLDLLPDEDIRRLVFRLRCRSTENVFYVLVSRKRMSEVRVKDYPVKKLTGSVLVDRIRSYVEMSMRKKGVYVDTETRQTKTGTEVVIHGRGFKAVIYEYEPESVVRFRLESTIPYADLGFGIRIQVPLTIVDESELDNALAKTMRARYARLKIS